MNTEKSEEVLKSELKTLQSEFDLLKKSYEDLLHGRDKEALPGHEAIATNFKNEELQMLMLIIEQSPVSIIITDVDGKIEFVNPKACETTGYTNAELIGYNPLLLKSNETTLMEYEESWQTIRGGGVWRGMYHNRRKSGEL